MENSQIIEQMNSYLLASHFFLLGIYIFAAVKIFNKMKIIKSPNKNSLLFIFFGDRIRQIMTFVILVSIANEFIFIAYFLTNKDIFVYECISILQQGLFTFFAVIFYFKESENETNTKG